jgi:predicted RNA-binding Zn-ribbon protein involved in translation (DUF1610 family)
MTKLPSLSTYSDVETPKLLHFTRRTLCTLYYALKQYQQVAKRVHTSICTTNDRNILPDRDTSTFKCPNYCFLLAEHCARCMKRRNNTNNSQNANTRRYPREMTTIAIPIDILRRLNSQITALYA